LIDNFFLASLLSTCLFSFINKSELNRKKTQEEGGLMDMRIRKHAEVLIKYSLSLKEDESLLIMTEIPSLPLARACFLEAIKIGAHPRIHISDNSFSELMLKKTNEAQLKKVIEYDKVRMQSFDAYLT